MAYDGIVMSRVVEQLNQTIIRGRITKLYQISQYELLLVIRSYAKNYKLLISIHPTYARTQLTYLDYPTPSSPNAYTMLMRKHLEGAYIESITQIGYDRLIDIVCVGTNELKDTVHYHLYIEIMGKHSNVTLTYDNYKIIDCLKRVSLAMNTQRILQPGAIYHKPPLITKLDPFTTDYQPCDNLTKIYQGFSKELSQEILYRIDQGETFNSIMQLLQTSTKLYIHNNKQESYHVIPLTHLQTDYQEYDLSNGLDQRYHLIDQRDRIKQQTSDLARYIHNEYQKNINKLHKLEKEKFDAQNSDEFRIKGDLLFANLHLIQKGQTSVTVENYYDNSMITIELDERYDGKTNAKKYYNKYQKAKNALQYINEQINITQEEIQYFDSLITLMDNANYYDALEIKEELENLGYLKKKKTKQIKKKTKLHVESYQTKDGTIIYVGKNNLQNDYLTFQFASRYDTWFHVKDMPGSHIIVHNDKLDEYTIRLAARMAAYFSKGKHSSSVPVNYTLVKTLKKPHARKPGQVILDHYQTIYIDPDDTFFNEITKLKQ